MWGKSLSSLAPAASPAQDGRGPLPPTWVLCRRRAAAQRGGAAVEPLPAKKAQGQRLLTPWQRSPGPRPPGGGSSGPRLLWEGTSGGPAQGALQDTDARGGEAAGAVGTPASTTPSPAPPHWGAPASLALLPLPPAAFHLPTSQNLRASLPPPTAPGPQPPATCIATTLASPSPPPLTSARPPGPHSRLQPPRRPSPMPGQSAMALTGPRVPQAPDNRPPSSPARDHQGRGLPQREHSRGQPPTRPGPSTQLAGPQRPGPCHPLQLCQTLELHAAPSSTTVARSPSRPS